CSETLPCRHVRRDAGGPITDPAPIAVCTSSTPSEAAYDDGPPWGRIDEDGLTRTACVFKSPAATPRPLLVWFHASGYMTSVLYDETSPRPKAESYDLGDGPGFSILAIQARNLHWPFVLPEDGTKHDTFHRDLASPSTNRDIANADAFIDEVVASGGIDT